MHNQGGTQGGRMVVSLEQGWLERDEQNCSVSIVTLLLLASNIIALLSLASDNYHLPAIFYWPAIIITCQQYLLLASDN